MPRIIARRLLRAFESELSRARPRDPALQVFLDAFQRIDWRQAALPAERRRGHPALDHLPAALVGARSHPDLVAAVRDAVEVMDWSFAYERSGREAAIADRMVAGRIAGKHGLVTPEGVSLGVFVIAPETYYALHGHQPTEIYYVLSGELTLEHGFGGRPFRVPAGSYSVTPTEMPHAFRTGRKPTLLVYSWVGDFSIPIWWWEKDRAGRWVKVDARPVASPPAKSPSTTAAA